MAYIHDVRKLVGHRPLILTSASGALVNEQHQVLLQARADTGDWSFPGGYMEFGETFAATVQREFKEDAGVVIRPVKLLALLDQDRYTYPNGDEVQPVNAFYLVKAVSSVHYAVKASETTAIRYFDLAGTGPRFFNTQNQRMWRILQQYYQLAN